MISGLNGVYFTGPFNSVWGKLEVTNGGTLLSNDQAMLRVSAPAGAPAADENAAWRRLDTRARTRPEAVAGA